MYFDLEQLSQKLSKLDFRSDSIENVSIDFESLEDTYENVNIFDSLESIRNQLKSEVPDDSIDDDDEQFSKFSCDSLNYQSLKHVQTLPRENFHIGCQHILTSRRAKNVSESAASNVLEFLILLGEIAPSPWCVNNVYSIF